MTPKRRAAINLSCFFFIFVAIFLINSNKQIMVIELSEVQFGLKSYA